MIALLEDGAPRFAGRKKDMLKVGGENVAASEVEAIILTVRGVQDVAVVGRPHRFLYEVPVTFVVASAPRPELERAIQDACAADLASFKRPRDVRFVEALPRLEIGKLDRKVLREQLRLEPPLA